MHFRGSPRLDSVLDADVLRAEMVARLSQTGALVSPAIERALLRVPRHLFLPEVDHRAAYANSAVIVRRDSGGNPISSASQPTMVVMMLEQLHVAAGQRVLEVGTGTGYNAALLADLVGETGLVVTIELEAELAATAGQALVAGSWGHVEVIVGDGRLGYPFRAPYDRIIVTAGAAEVAASWTEQLTNGGRLVVPVVDRLGIGSVVVFDNIDGHLRRGAQARCGFLRLRDAAQTSKSE